MESNVSMLPGFVRRPRRLWDGLCGISVEVAFWEAPLEDFADDFDFVILKMRIEDEIVEKFDEMWWKLFWEENF